MIEQDPAPEYYFENDPSLVQLPQTKQMIPDIVKVSSKAKQPTNEDDLIFAFQDPEEDTEDNPLPQPNPTLPYITSGSTKTVPLTSTSSGNLSVVHRETPWALQNKNMLLIERVLFFPQKFYLHDSTGKLLVCARKKLLEINSLYYFFDQADMESTKNGHFVGYMTADHTCTEYRLYSADDEQMAAFNFIIKKSTPGLIGVFISDGTSKKPIGQRITNNCASLTYMASRQPQLNARTGKYSTKLEGLGKVSSCKNCAIVLDGQNCLVMGKQKEKQYNLHYSKPWSHLMALGFAIANYEDKDVIE